MKLNAASIGILSALLISLPACGGQNTAQTAPSSTPSPSATSTQATPATDQAMKDVTGLTAQQKIDMLTQNKGKFGGGDALRRFFFGDLEPLAVQPGGAGMVVNLYNKANDVTFAYCATYDVVVAIKQGKVTAFAPEEVK